MDVHWRHYSATANADGIAWVLAGAPPTGSQVISGGGFAEAWTNQNQDSTDTSGNESSGLVPIAGMKHDGSYWIVGFAAPPGASLRTHTFAITL